MAVNKAAIAAINASRNQTLNALNVRVGKIVINLERTIFKGLAGLCFEMETSTLSNSSVTGSFDISSHIDLRYLAGCVGWLKNSTVSRVNGDVNITIYCEASSQPTVGGLFGLGETVVCEFLEFSGSVSYTGSSLDLGCIFGIVRQLSQLSHLVARCDVRAQDLG